MNDHFVSWCYLNKVGYLTPHALKLGVIAAEVRLILTSCENLQGFFFFFLNFFKTKIVMDVFDWDIIKNNNHSMDTP